LFVVRDSWLVNAGPRGHASTKNEPRKTNNSSSCRTTAATDHILIKGIVGYRFDGWFHNHR